MSSRPDCIFEIHHRTVYSNYYCSCSFELEIIRIGRLSHKMYSNSIVNFQESTTILNAHTKIVWKLIEGTTYLFSFSNSHPLSKKGVSFFLLLGFLVSDLQLLLSQSVRWLLLYETSQIFVTRPQKFRFKGKVERAI